MRVLVVDDEENVRKGIATFLELSGHEAVGVEDLAAARSALMEGGPSALESAAPFGAALVDVYIGTEDGASLLDFASERRLASPIIMMSGKGTVKDAVAAVRKGAYDFLEKPLDTDRLLAILRNLERESAALRRLDAFSEAWLEEHVYIGKGSTLTAAFTTARKTAASPLSILVSGPTGSGKELVARWIHLCSPRSQGSFVPVNCAAIPPDLAESAFFGSRKGAFTGASSDRPGYFETASGGTLFLDEVGELDLSLQAALLRAVETGEIQPVGADRASRADARIVAATNRDLRGEIAAGRFREDLYWRLAQAHVVLPSLAERREDIRGLAEFLASPIRSQMGHDAPTIGESALAYLESRPWPGNVRELRAFLERALWLAPPGTTIGAGYIAGLEASPPAQASLKAEAPHPGLPEEGGHEAIKNLAEAKEIFERAYVGRALAEAGGSVARAAELLGLLPNNLSRKLKELGLR
ncbi:MAG: sigma-54 dependent transcriptional regulator [Rectinemataceae bacterium]|jgi:DNA-binding NtrC family response regulator